MGLNPLEKIVASKRLPVLFIGSGISRRYLYQYPDWKELLEQSFYQYNKDSFQLQKHIHSLSANETSDFFINTNLASIIEHEYNDAFFNRDITLNVGNSKNPNWVKRGISPYKMYLSNKFRKMKLNRNPKLLCELDHFKQLKNKVSAIITTNYDLFLERHVFPEDYTVFVNQEELFSPDSYNIAEIYKIHGSASDANSLIVTSNDYEKFMTSKKLLVAKMLTLFAESPIVFMGYSLTDENILSIITDFLSCISPADMENIHEHFVFISYKKGESDLVEIRQTITTPSGISIPISEIQTDNFIKVFDILNQITPGISPTKVRETRRVIKTIVDTSIASSEAESIFIELDDLEQIDLTNKPLAIAIGYRENMLSKLGYGIFDDELILEDILFDNKNFDATKMCLERYKSLPITRLLPVFKYVKNSTAEIPSNSKLAAYIDGHNSIDKIISKSTTKAIKNLPSIGNYEELLKISEELDVNKKSGLLLKNINNFTLEEIRLFCQSLFSNNDIGKLKSSTNFKRCVMYLDFKENYSI